MRPAVSPSASPSRPYGLCGRLRPRPPRAGLSATQPLEGGLAHVAGAGPARELDLGHQLGPQPSAPRSGLPSAHSLAGGEGTRVGGSFLRPRACCGTRERITPRRSRCRRGRHRRACSSCLRRDARRPAANAGVGLRWSSSRRCTTSCPARHFGLGPARPNATGFDRVQSSSLGHDPFQPEHAAGRLQHRIARGLLEVLDVAQARGACPCNRREQRLEPLLALRRMAAVAGPRLRGKQQVEREEDQIFRLAVRQRRLQGGEKSGAPSRIERHRSRRPGSRQSGSLLASLTIAANFSDQSSPLRVLHGSLAVPDAKLHAIAVELDLVRPSRPPFGARSTSLRRAAARRRSGISAT
jgi:hypothetical protein